ncbi:MAG TPA: arylamine N-acetyltransferase [Solirubrobacteraceae bacterium]|nr:arylamine N-acetyltransferase [Solirubrobacteraceae bacterium]
MTAAEPAFDLAAYLSRVGCDSRPGIVELHRAHAGTIPFENLDPQRGVPVALARGALQDKLVAAGRGGYCFEQNLLLREALLALGAEVDMFLARVRYGADAGVTRPRSHLVLRASLDGETWHADVGFGLGTPLEPLPWGPGSEREIAGWRYRVVQGGAELVLQAFEDGGWSDLYGFVPDPVPLIDVETINWWVCTYPTSPFVTGLVVSTQARDGSRTTLSDWDGLALTERTPGGSSRTELRREQVPALLAERFGLDGFVLDERERLVPA